jgi:hypothetical protein
MANIEDPYNSPISIGDAVSMFTTEIQKNARPYTRAVIEANNKLVNRWKKEMVVPLADDKCTLPSGALVGMWTLFLEGVTIKSYIEMRNKGMMPDIEPEVLEYWKEFFETMSVEDMHAYGTGLVSYGFTLIQNHFKRWYAEQKWERFYSKYPDDPVAWYNNYKEHKALITGKETPFWDEETTKDVNERVATVLQVQVKVKGATGFRA